jgi:hypothetical protein
MSKDGKFLGIAITGLSCLGAFCIMVIVFCRPSADNNQAILQIVALITPTLIALAGAFKSIETKQEVKTQVSDLKTTVDGNACHLQNLNAQVQDVKTTAAIAAETAVSLASEVDKLKGV